MAWRDIPGPPATGGTHGQGVVFCMLPDRSDYRVLHHFAIAESGPMEGVIAVDDRLYGATVCTAENDTFGLIYSLQMERVGPQGAPPI